jgi:hypothetical protein
MAKVRDILKHVDIEAANRSRVCHHSRGTHRISKAEVCLVIYEARGSRKNYCRECAAPILERARAELDRMDGQLRGTGPF